MKCAIMIPARMQSSRFPGKPLALINGRPMFVHVYNACIAADPMVSVFVATDSEEIADAAVGYGIEPVMTGDCATGTDRVCAAVRTLGTGFDWVVSVQGDEPLVSPADINTVLSCAGSEHPVNCWAWCEPNEAESTATIKVALNDYGEMVYASRALIPGEKMGKLYKRYRKQVCIYGFSRDHLLWYGARRRGTAEALEDVEILRFLEHGAWRIRMKEAHATIAVDYPEDIQRVEAYLREHEGR